MWLTKVVTVIVIIVCSRAEKDSQQSDKSGYKRSLSKNCEQSYSATCLKLDIVSWVDKLNEDKNYNIFPGVSIVRENISENTADIVTDLARDFPNDPDARLDAFILRKVQGYLSDHAIRVSLFDQDDAESARKGGGGGGGGGGGKKGGGMGMMLAVAAMMKGTMMAIALSALAAMAGKAMMTAMISLMISGMIGLKSLSGGGKGKTTYEVISKPIMSHSHTSSHEDYQQGGGHSGYGRSFDMPLPLALQPDYKPE